MFTKQVDQRAKSTYSLSVKHEPPNLLSTVFIFAINACISSLRRKPVRSTTAAELSKPIKRYCKASAVGYINAEFQVQGRPQSYPKSFCKSLSIVSDCPCIDLPFPHPAVTWPNQAVSEIDLFTPSRYINGTKTHTRTKLCKPPGKSRLLQLGQAWGAHTLPSCCDSHIATARGWWDMRQRAEPPSRLDTGFKVFLKALGWGCSIAVLLQRNQSNNTRGPQV